MACALTSRIFGTFFWWICFGDFFHGIATPRACFAWQTSCPLRQRWSRFIGPDRSMADNFDFIDADQIHSAHVNILITPCCLRMNCFSKTIGNNYLKMCVLSQTYALRNLPTNIHNLLPPFSSVLPAPPLFFAACFFFLGLPQHRRGLDALEI